MNRKQRRANAKPGDTGTVRFAQADQLLIAGRAAEAERLYHAILADDPCHAGSLHRLGLIAHQSGRSDRAAEFLRAAIAIDPRAAVYHAHLGLALAAMGQNDEAIASLRTALSLDAAADTAFNLGSLLAARGNWADAAAAYRQAIACDPRLTEANAALASVLAGLSLENLGVGDNEGALAAIVQSLHVHETPQNRRVFVHVVKDMEVRQATALKPLLLRALAWARPEDLARVCADVLRDEADLANDPLLLALLPLAPNQDVALEARLTTARAALLQKAQAGGVIEDFDSALAQQCFLNEYVFANCEENQAQALRNQLVDALADGMELEAPTVIAVASYFPLSSLPGGERLLERQWPDAVQAVLTQQLREPAQEAHIVVPRLTAVTDPTSCAVQKQYEENPYPRWARLAPAPQSESLADFLHQKFPHAAIASGSDILIAGCGTGRNAIETAQLFRNARVLAIDLSRASLAYAIRKTPPDMTIEYARADLLALGTLDRRFDLIEAIGVLHHLADPFAGWRVLVGLLKSGGVMHVALYSTAARRDLKEARTSLAGVTDIRHARQCLIAAGSPVTQRPDFFTVSTCRDLLFHVCEHTLTLPQIAAFLKGEGLAFLGFDLDEAVLTSFRQYSSDPADLENWHIFEQDHPETFAGMYHFWIAKM